MGSHFWRLRRVITWPCRFAHHGVQECRAEQNFPLCDQEAKKRQRHRVPESPLRTHLKTSHPAPPLEVSSTSQSHQEGIKLLVPRSVEDTEDPNDSKPGKQASEETHPADTLILDFRLPEQSENKFQLLFKPLRLWCSATAHQPRHAVGTPLWHT